jgi:FKBP-type peptidyl-prolyl cis-trans isomerase
MRALFAIFALVLMSACASMPGVMSAEERAEKEKIMAEQKRAEERAQSVSLFTGGDANYVTTASGLRYRVLKKGADAGPLSKATDTVSVHYEGWLIDGEVFDSSYARGEPAEFPVNRLIPAWTEALQMMRPGDQWEIYAPSNIAYGARGAGGVIPPNADLVFRLEILAIRSQ